MTPMTKRTRTSFQKLARAALASREDADLSKLATTLIKKGFLEEATEASEGEDPEDALRRFKRIRELKATLRKEAKRLAEGEFESRARSIFDRYPEVESFGWRQSTPTETQEASLSGFMRVHAETPFINGEVQPWRSPRDQDGAAGSVRRLAAYLFWDTELKDMFGDGYHITVTRPSEEGGPISITKEHWWPDDMW